LASATAALAICLPWAVAAPRPFWHGVLFLDWDLPPRADSLSLFSIALRLGVDPGYLLIAGLTGVALVAGLLLLPRNAYGFLGGCALVMTWFNLASKQSYFNEWELAAGLIVLCMASVAGTSDVELLPRPRWRRRPRPMVVAPG
jgi:hypothetical protein